jgi:hypothetical protein
MLAETSRRESTVNEFRVGEVLGTTFQSLGRKFVPIALIVAIFNAPALLYEIAGTYSSPVEVLVLQIVQMVLSSMAIGAVSLIVYRELRGEPASAGKALSFALARVVPLALSSLLFGVVVGVGLLLLVVPGLILMCIYFVVIPAVMIEGVGVGEAFRRSGELTKGSRLPIFGLAVLLGVGFIVLAAIVGAILGALGTVVVSVLFGSASATAQVVTYYRLREVREGVSIESLAGVFD